MVHVDSDPYHVQFKDGPTVYVRNTFLDCDEPGEELPLRRGKTAPAAVVSVSGREGCLKAVAASDTVTAADADDDPELVVWNYATVLPFSPGDDEPSSPSNLRGEELRWMKTADVLDDGAYWYSVGASCVGASCAGASNVVAGGDSAPPASTASYPVTSPRIGPSAVLPVQHVPVIGPASFSSYYPAAEWMQGCGVGPSHHGGLAGGAFAWQVGSNHPQAFFAGQAPAVTPLSPSLVAAVPVMTPHFVASAPVMSAGEWMPSPFQSQVSPQPLSWFPEAQRPLAASSSWVPAPSQDATASDTTMAAAGKVAVTTTSSSQIAPRTQVSGSPFDMSPLPPAACAENKSWDDLPTGELHQVATAAAMATARRLAPLSSAESTMSSKMSSKTSPAQSPSQSPDLGPAPPPQPQTMMQTVCSKTNTRRIYWTVDAAKLHGSDRIVVSPAFEIPLFSPAEFKMMLSPRAGGSFRKAKGHGVVQLKLEAYGRELEQTKPLTFSMTIGNGGTGVGVSNRLASAKRRDEHPPPRGPVQHDFNNGWLCGLPRGQDVWDFNQVVDVASQTFYICIEVLVDGGA
eukprot:TRINITY_DN28462_c0_g1_i1.p1 TRINITY_DN28462_c0_g1~~TRINITY_DN28462_c0_g1_i1.p1  ORF type:complete len:572 (-),score=118.72 TRINITY_DN28462_c0_g1_i1:298-2013(-)